MSYTRAQGWAFLRDQNFSDSSAKAVRVADRILNRAASALHQAGLWDFDKLNTKLVFAAPKSAGTVSLANAGTALTGVGTAFAAGDVGKFMRISGGALTYKVGTYGSATTLTMETFQDESAVAAAYELTQPRIALPSRFRSFARPSSGDGLFELAPFNDVRDLWRRRRLEKQVSIPRCYAIEWIESSGYKIPYLWVYPDPSEAYVMELAYYKWPEPIVVDADTFGVPDIEAAHTAVEEFILAYMYREQGAADWTTQLQAAIANARESLGEFRAMDEEAQREYYTDPDDEVKLYRVRAGPGILD